MAQISRDPDVAEKNWQNCVEQFSRDFPFCLDVAEKGQSEVEQFSSDPNIQSFLFRCGGEKGKTAFEKSFSES